MDTGTWRSKLQPNLRKRAVNRIMDALKSHIQVNRVEGLQEHREIAVSYEEDVYIIATTQSEYMRKICFKILSIETRSQKSMPYANSNTVNSSGPASLYSTNGEDWQEELFKKIKAMKDLYLLDLNHMHQKLSRILQRQESLPQQAYSENIEKMKLMKNMVERFMEFLQISKHNILPIHKHEFAKYEERIVHVVTSHRRYVAPTQPLPPPHLQ